MPGELLTIGAFARLARLSAKALRLYDDLGLLPPAHVDPHSGYRFYAPHQLERARLVAWLRRLGMPLARIRAVCALSPDAAAHEVAQYWARVEADTAARRDLAAFLVGRLSEKHDKGDKAEEAAVMAQGMGTLEIRYAVRSQTGLVRESNQDTAYADGRLLAVADGYGGGGAQASAAAVEAAAAAAATAAGAEVHAGDLLNALEDAVYRANGRMGEIEESGTTLTALLWTGSRLALVHIGDSRAHLLRDGGLFQITHDHTLVQSLIDEGRLTPEEARSHPQRALLLRALDGRVESVPELGLHEARAGDRYLLCSDGLSAVVPAGEIRAVLTTAPDPQSAVGGLLALAHRAGAPDNVSCVVADVTAAA